MLIMTVIAQVKPLKRQEFLQVLHSLYINGEEKKGVKKSMIYQEMEDPNSFRLILELATRKNLETHLNGEEFGVLLGALEVLCAESQIRYSYTPEEGSEVPESKS